MTVTYTDCSTLTITSSNLLSTNTSVVLSMQYNCDQEWEKVITPATAPIVLTPEDFDTEDFIPDGIYYLKLEIVNSVGTEIVETKCKFVNCITSCKLLDAYKNNDCERTMAFFALLASDDCPDCSCADLCLLYNIATNNPCEDVKPCGCK